jgi:hypothetical protein
MVEVLAPSLLNWSKVSTLPQTSLEVSKLHREVWEVFLLGGGPSKELSESMTAKQS